MNGLELNIDWHGEDDFKLELACEIDDTGITGLFGPSGSGKTSLLGCIAGLRNPGAGSSIRFRGQSWLEAGVSLPTWQRHIGFVFQDARLFPHLNVEQNLAYAIKRRKLAGPDINQVSQWLKLAGMLSQNVQTLSAGQKQRVAIARALLSAPQLLLLDEPFANLDKQARRECLGLVKQLCTEINLPVIFVSHDYEEICELADQVILMDSGRITNQGPLIELSCQLDTQLAQEEQAAAILSGTVASHDEPFGLTLLDVEGHTLYVKHLQEAPGQSRRLRVPARDVSLCRQLPQDSSILNILPVVLEEIQVTTQARALLRLSLGEQTLLAQITRKSVAELQLQTGNHLYAQIKSVALLSEGGS